MVLINDNTNAVYQYTNNKRWVRYIDTLQLGPFSIKRFPLQFEYHIAIIHHDKLTFTSEFRIDELGLML